MVTRANRRTGVDDAPTLSTEDGSLRRLKFPDVSDVPGRDWAELG